MRGHDLTKKKTMTKTNAKAKTKTQDKYISRTPSNSDPKDLFVSFDTFYQSDEGT